MADIADIKLVVDLELLTVDDLIAIEEGATMRQTRNIFARFVQNGTGEYLSEEDAVPVIGSMSIAELRRQSALLKEQIEAIKDQVADPK